MAKQKPLSHSLIYPFAGHFTLVRHLEDNSNSRDPKDIYNSGNVLMQSQNSQYTLTSEEIPDGNSMYAGATRVTQVEHIVSLAMNSYDPNLYAFIKGIRPVTIQEDYQWYPKVPMVIEPSTGGGTIKLLDVNGEPVSIEEKDFPAMVSLAFSNEPFVRVDGEADPEEGEYKVDLDTGVFTFNEADVGKHMNLSIPARCEELIKYVEPATMSNETFTLITSGPAEDYSGVAKEYITETYDSVQLDGELSTPDRSKEATESNISFKTVTPRGCEPVVTKRSPQIFDFNVC